MTAGPARPGRQPEFGVPRSARQGGARTSDPADLAGGTTPLWPPAEDEAPAGGYHAGFLPGADDESPIPHGRVEALDGVRALAVLLVVLFHIGVPGLSGGFLGVDVFFVLSGFLITTLLLRDIVQHGRIDLPRFWARRMARLMPAVLVVLIVVGIWAMTGAPAFRRAQLGGDILWSLIYLGNWHFIASSSYFAFDGTTSPLVHLWSLAVEEQFYVVWPLILQAVALLLASMSSGRHARRDLVGARRRSTNAVMITGALIGLVSIVLLAHSFATAGPDRAYMGTDAKVFEPLLGAVFAAAALRSRVSEFVGRHAAHLVVAGGAGLLLAVALLGGAGGPHPSYYYGGAVLTSLAVVALVAGATRLPPDSHLGHGFTHPVVTYLGRISYGIYLWHWPWAVWLLPHGQFEFNAAMLVLAATLVSAAASYHLLELPLRSGRFRRARPARILRSGLAGMAACSAVPVLLGATPWYAGALPAVEAADQTTLLLVGDSVPNQLYGAFAGVGEKQHVTVVNGAHGGCSAAGMVTVNPDGTPYDPPTPRIPGASDGPICAGVAADQKELVDREKPGVVLWWSRYEYSDFLDRDGHVVRDHDPGYREAQARFLDEAVDRLTAGGASLVVVRPEPTGARTAAGCTPERHDKDGECAAFLVRLRFEDDARQGWIATLEEKARKDPRLRLLPVADLFCRDEANPCDDRQPIAVNGSFPPPVEAPARTDGSHFAPELREPIATSVLGRVLSTVRSARS